MLDKEVVLVGYSGHGYVVAEAALLNRFPVKFYTDLEPVKLDPFHLKYAGYEGNPSDEWSNKDYFILGIGDNQIRQRTAEILNSNGKNILNVLHPSVSLSQKIIMGSGNFFARNVSIPLLVSIGSYCIFNTGCIIEHECKIGDTVHVGPGAVLAGNVHVGEGSFIGANAVVKQGVKIGKNVIVGAGSVVLKDIANNTTVVGNPGRKI
ncbi:acetyltransferase [Salinimicrobium tongyeongense]|uniref:Acetyltransferase n=1 Tax=Salinimicrobium tongyeongense TaxID=2809707 RepID=A0ABY6NRJ3_9FLAO|nr:acetyltransferase [Salinimicrobium tongyeongense]UZH55529.1 acetyltransferase [Salinimicrobium tongyeongense]